MNTDSNTSSTSDHRALPPSHEVTARLAAIAAEDPIEHLITRLTGEADDIDPADWRHFRELAAARPDAWQRLAEAQQISLLLARDVEHALAPALTVELPFVAERAPLQSMDSGSALRLAVADAVTSAGPTAGLPAVEPSAASIQVADASAAPRPRALAGLWRHTGWAAAVLLAAAWGVTERPWNTDDAASHLAGPPAFSPSRMPVEDLAVNRVTPGLDEGVATARPASYSADELRQQYLALPEVVRELPPQLIQKTETPEGTLMTYLRVFVEQGYVEDTFRPLIDDVGRPAIVVDESDRTPAFAL